MNVFLPMVCGFLHPEDVFRARLSSREFYRAYVYDFAERTRDAAAGGDDDDDDREAVRDYHRYLCSRDLEPTAAPLLGRAPPPGLWEFLLGRRARGWEMEHNPFNRWSKHPVKPGSGLSEWLRYRRLCGRLSDLRGYTTSPRCQRLFDAEVPPVTFLAAEGMLRLETTGPGGPLVLFDERLEGGEFPVVVLDEWSEFRSVLWDEETHGNAIREMARYPIVHLTRLPGHLKGLEADLFCARMGPA